MTTIYMYICMCIHIYIVVSLVAQTVKESACNVEDTGSIPGLGRSPGEGNATHSNSLAKRTQWTEEPSGLQSMGWQRVGHDWATELNWTSFSPLLFASFLFTAILRLPQPAILLFLHFFFMGIVLILVSCAMSWTSVHSSSGILSDLIPWVYLSLPLCNRKGFYLGHTWMVSWFSWVHWD